MIKIIPAIDIIDGQCVRLTQGDYTAKKVYDADPVEVARRYEAAGLRYLHVVDLDGAKARHIVNWRVLESICRETNLEVDFGGGLKTDEDLKIAFESGAHKITGGSIAVKNQDLFVKWIETYGADRIILGADVKDEQIAISGWQDLTRLNIFQFIENYLPHGIQTVICTDIQKDGALQGVSEDLYQRLHRQFPDLEIIASGGVSHIKDVERLQEMGIPAVIIGKAFYEHMITFEEITPYL